MKVILGGLLEDLGDLGDLLGDPLGDLLGDLGDLLFAENIPPRLPRLTLLTVLTMSGMHIANIKFHCNPSDS